MLARLIRLIVSSAFLGAACVAYQWTFVRWLEQDRVTAALVTQLPVVRAHDRLSSLFPESSWQRGNCKRLQTRDGVLLFDQLKQIDDDQWKLWPVSVVLGTQGDQPLVLEAPEGAEIKFAESLDVMSGGAPPIERGRMIGKVHIHGAISSDDSRRIEIEASEVGIDHRKLWTTQPIRLRLGDARLAGRDLTLHLATGGGIPSGTDAAISVLDRLELIYLDELFVPLPQQGSVSRPGAPGASAHAKCAGRVVFHFATGELTLRDRVVLEHRTGDGNADRFECGLIRLRLADLLRSRPAGDGVDDVLLSLFAEGHPLRATIPRWDASLTAEQLMIDTKSGMIQIRGQDGVEIAYAGNRGRFAQVDYQLDPENPTRIGMFAAPGPGAMRLGSEPSDALASRPQRRVDPSTIPLRELTWSAGVRLEPSESADAATLVLRVDGEVTGALSDGGSCRCDSAMLVMQMAVPPTLDEAVTDSPSSMASMPRRPWSNLQIKRFQAAGRVQLQSADFSIATRLLQLYFENVPAGQSPRSGAATLGSKPRGRAGTSMTLGSYFGSQQADEGSATSTPIRVDRPQIHGDTINAKLRLAGDELTATDLTVVGNVVLKHNMQTPSGPLLATLTGEQLQMTDGGGNEVLQIGSGVDQPAKFLLGDGYFIGPMIQIRMADNVVWIRDAGEFQLPSQIMPSFGGTTVSAGTLRSTTAEPPTKASTIRWLTPPRCRWQGQMIFDGRTVVLSDGVDFHATLVAGEQKDIWDLALTGDQVQVVLEQDVKVRDVDSVRGASIHHVSITSSDPHPLLLTANQLNSLGMRQSRHLLAAPELTLSPDRGTLNGSGPGWYRAWTMSQSLPGLVASQAPEVGDDPSMTGLHLVYQQSLEADLNQHQLDFLRGVRIASRAVGSWEDRIEVEKMEGLRQGESMLDCDRLRLAIDQSRVGLSLTVPWELEAMGGVAFQTRNEKGLFSGNADRASYAAIKDLFLIEGAPGQPASFNQTLPTGQAGMSLAVKRMAVNPKSMELENVELDRFNFGTLPQTRR